MGDVRFTFFVFDIEQNIRARLFPSQRVLTAESVLRYFREIPDIYKRIYEDALIAAHDIADLDPERARRYHQMSIYAEHISKAFRDYRITLPRDKVTELVDHALLRRRMGYDRTTQWRWAVDQVRITNDNYQVLNGTSPGAWGIDKRYIVFFGFCYLMLLVFWLLRDRSDRILSAASVILIATFTHVLLFLLKATEVSSMAACRAYLLAEFELRLDLKPE